MISAKLNTKYLLSLSAVLVAMFNYQPKALAGPYENCMYQYNDEEYCSQGRGDQGSGDSRGGQTVDPRYANEANQLREQGIQVFHTAYQKTGDQRFNQLADALANANIVAGTDGDCNGESTNGFSSSNAYTMVEENTIYFCYPPDMNVMHVLLHETVHLTQRPGENKRVECEADTYMIKAFYYGLGQIEPGHYDHDANGAPYCTENIALEKRLRNGH